MTTEPLDRYNERGELAAEKDARRAIGPDAPRE